MNVFQNEKILVNLPVKNRNAVQLACAFPNTYTVGMASLGFQTAWKLFNQNPALNVSRWFTDAWESRSSHYIGFSFSWELDYKNIFSMLEKNNIPLHANERGTNDPIVFCGGQVPNANPEPFCENFDFFLIGDLEIVAEDLINKMVEIKGLAREERLNALSKLDGVYVPHCKGLPWQALTKKLTSKGNLTSSSILTPDSVWPNTFIVEVVRSCPELCRFCLASYGSLPFRTPDVKDSLIPIIDFGLKHTNKIGLLGASVTQHPEFEELLEHLLSKSVEICHGKSLQVQIASVRADSVTKKTADGLLKLRSKSLTMAVETGSERLRNVINKKVSNETIIKSIETIYNSGFNSIKLYGMVGLPGEAKEDIDATVKLLSEIKKLNKGKNLTWGCSVFVPKAQTPFQWFGADKGADKKLKYLSKELHKTGVDFRPESYEWSLIQALISRGDKSINKILEDAYRYGSTIGSFKKAVKENKNIDCDNFIFKEWDRSIKLPWESIQGYLNKEIIKEHSRVLVKSDGLF